APERVARRSGNGHGTDTSGRPRRSRSLARRGRSAHCSHRRGDHCRCPPKFAVALRGEAVPSPSVLVQRVLLANPASGATTMGLRLALVKSGGLIALEVTGRTVSLDHRPRHSQKSFRIANGSGSVREFGWCTQRDSNPCVSYDTCSPIVYGHSTIRRPKTDATKTRRHKFLYNAAFIGSNGR